MLRNAAISAPYQNKIVCWNRLHLCVAEPCLLLPNHSNWNFPRQKGKNVSFLLKRLISPRTSEVLSLPGRSCFLFQNVLGAAPKISSPLHCRTPCIFSILFQNVSLLLLLDIYKIRTESSERTNLKKLEKTTVQYFEH